MSHNSNSRASGAQTYALIVGALCKTVESKVSKNGNRYCVATIRVQDGEVSQFWKITTFSESAQEELLRLSHGDALSAQGKMTLSVWQPDNGSAPRVNCNMVADNILALRQRPKKREARQTEPRAEERRRPEPQRAANGMRTYGAHSAEPGLNDDIDF